MELLKEKGRYLNATFSTKTPHKLAWRRIRNVMVRDQLLTELCRFHYF
jgi:hypothetical protein